MSDTTDLTLGRRWHVQPRGPLRGSVEVPGDKSIAHRALMLNAIAEGPARVRGLPSAGDVRCTMQALRQLGVSLQQEGNVTWVIPPDGGLKEPDEIIHCGNSGTSMRLLIGLLSACNDFFCVLTGDASLIRRPMGRVVEPLREMGAIIDGRQSGHRAPISIRGSALAMIEHDLTVASAQVKSALLIAGLPCGVAVREPGPSRDHTERMLVRMGAPLMKTPEGWVVLVPTPRLQPVDVDVPGDFSAAAFHIAAAILVPGSEVTITGVGINPTRTGMLDILEAMGADVQVYPRGTVGPEPVADIVVRHGPLYGAPILGELTLRAIDEIPVLAVLASFARGETLIGTASELRFKESDRIAKTVVGLRALGVEVEERPDGMIIQGGRPRGLAEIDATGDHRIAMAFAVAGLAAPGGTLLWGSESMGSSYPHFPQDLEKLLAADYRS